MWCHFGAWNAEIAFNMAAQRHSYKGGKNSTLATIAGKIFCQKSLKPWNFVQQGMPAVKTYIVSQRGNNCNQCGQNLLHKKLLLLQQLWKAVIAFKIAQKHLSRVKQRWKLPLMANNALQCGHDKSYVCKISLALLWMDSLQMNNGYIWIR